MDLFFHLLTYGFIAAVSFFGLIFFLWGISIIVLAAHWVTEKLEETQCPKCKGYFKRKLAEWKVADEREVLRTVNRVDEGTLYSNSLFVPNQGIAINRKEQVSCVEQTIQRHWECKDPACSHKWETEETSEFEGSLDN